jgi:hypothetical protein
VRIVVIEYVQHPQSHLGPVILTPESILAPSEAVGAEEGTVEGGHNEGGAVEDAEIFRRIVKMTLNPNDKHTAVSFVRWRLVAKSLELDPLLRRTWLQSIRVCYPDLWGEKPSWLDARPWFCSNRIIAGLEFTPQDLVHIHEVYLHVPRRIGLQYPLCNRFLISEVVDKLVEVRRPSPLRVIVVVSWEKTDNMDWVVVSGVSEPLKGRDDIELIWRLEEVPLINVGWWTGVPEPPTSWNLNPIPTDDNLDYRSPQEPAICPASEMVFRLGHIVDLIHAVNACVRLRELEVLCTNRTRWRIPTYAPPSAHSSDAPLVFDPLTLKMSPDDFDSTVLAGLHSLTWRVCSGPTPGPWGLIGEDISPSFTFLRRMLARWPSTHALRHLVIHLDFPVPYNQRDGCEGWEGLCEQTGKSLSTLGDVLTLRQFENVRVELSIKLSPAVCASGFPAEYFTPEGLKVPAYEWREQRLIVEQRFQDMGLQWT